MTYKLGDHFYVLPEKVQNHPNYGKFAGMIGIVSDCEINTGCVDLKFSNGKIASGISLQRCKRHTPTKLEKALL